MGIKSRNKEIGNLGEDIACRFLMKRGFKLITRNYLRKYGEIDIVVEKETKIHFVEVKTVSRSYVSHETWGDHRPEENVHHNKIQRMRRVIQVYLSEQVSPETEWFFDIVTVLLDREAKKAKVSFMENIIL